MSSRAPIASGFYARPWPERLRALELAGWLTADDAQKLQQGRALLDTQSADRLVENAVGVLGLPMGVGLGLVVDGRAYVTPMVVEEPSIIAAQSSAAKLVARCGGFTTQMSTSLLAGEIQIVDVHEAQAAVSRINAAKQTLMQSAKALQPKMVARGGGIRDITGQVCGSGGHSMVIVHLWVDTCDAMGANAVNTLCEAMGPQVASIAGGRLGLRILSNLCDRSVVTVTCTVQPEVLAVQGLCGEKVRDQIVMASRMAECDVYRAVTHNKGIMNGIDAVAVATGNDWRAIEAGAHAYAGLGQGYRPLSVWRADASGNLTGTMALPLKVGIVGGNFLANPTAAMALRLLNVGSAQELARVMAAVGLAQNLAALKALGTTGIQAGHMALHARSVVASAGAKAEHFDEAVRQVLESQDVKLERAQVIVQQLEAQAAAAADAPAQMRRPKQAAAPQKEAVGEGFGKLIVLGEHAVVYGSHALAVPLILATRVAISASSSSGIRLCIPAWNIDEPLPPALDAKLKHHRLHQSMRLMVDALHLGDRSFDMTVQPRVPRAMGLGSSAALAVATVRALSAYFELNLSDQSVIDLAFESEKVAHGTPSGVDNALAALGCPLLFKKASPTPHAASQRVGKTLHWVVGLSHTESLTAVTVRAVRARAEACPELYQGIFNQIDALALQGAQAMAEGDRVHLGRLMNVNHGLLHALDVSVLPIEHLVLLARSQGALGAKVTGGGGGGSMLALCADEAMQQRIADAFVAAGFQALKATTEKTDANQ